MSQSPQEAKPQPRGIGYSIVYPPGWREFRTSADHEAILAKLVTAEAKALGRADVVLMLRQKTHEMFENLRRRGAIGLALPVEKARGGAVPTSMIMTPLKSSEAGALAGMVRRVADGNPVETEAVDDETWYLWNTNEPAEEAPEYKNLSLNMVVPRPRADGSTDPEPTAGLWLRYSYASLETGENNEEFTEALRGLGYAIMGTFKWVLIQ